MRVQVLILLSMFSLSVPACCLASPANQVKPVNLLKPVNPVNAGKQALGGRRPDSPRSVWVVKQETQYFGPVLIYISKDAVRVVIRNGELNMVSLAPDWNVITYNSAEKKEFPMSRSEWRKKGTGMVQNLVQKEHTQTPVFDKNLKLECLEFKSRCDQTFYGARDPMIFRSTAGSKKIKQVTSRFTKDFELSDGVQDFLCGLYNTSGYFGIPIEAVFQYEDGTIMRPYRTVAMKSSSVERSFFAYPKGYETTADRSALIISKARTKQVHEMLDSIIEEETAVDKGKP